MRHKKAKPVVNAELYGQGYADCKAGCNGTGKTPSYDLGWMDGFRDLHSISWERKYNDWSKD